MHVFLVYLCMRSRIGAGRTGGKIVVADQIYPRTTRVNNVNQSARLFTFCVLGQSECLKFEIYKQRSEKITPCSTPSVPFDIKLFTLKYAFFFNFLGGIFKIRSRTRNIYV